MCKKVAVLFVMILLMVACSPSEQNPEQSSKNNSKDTYIESGDLEEIKQHGQLRVLTPGFQSENKHFPRKGLPINFESQLAEKFAKHMGLAIRWVYVSKFEELIPKLTAGEGDVIVANLTETRTRKKQIDFSAPIYIVKEQLVTKSDDPISKQKQLSGRTIAVQKSTSFWSTAQRLKDENPKLKIETIPENYSVSDILREVATGKFDLSIADSNVVDAVKSYETNVKAAFDLTNQRNIAWGVRKKSPELKRELNKYLLEKRLAKRNNGLYKTDLNDIKKRNVLRVLTRNNPATYFLWRGELLGFEYELMKKFAEQQNIRLEMIVVPTRDALTDWLRDGKGDVVAASLTNDSRRKLTGLSFTNRYNKVKEYLVSRSDDDSLNSIADLSGRTIAVRKSSSYWQRVKDLQQQGIKVELLEVPEILETEEIIAKVANNEFDLTISDSHIVDIELTWRNDIKAALTLQDNVEHGWLVRNDQQQLLAALNQYIKKEYRGLFYNISYRKYFQKPRTIKKRLQQRVDKPEGGQLSPYDTLVMTYADQYHLDWRMVISQMYQESRFNPKAKSWVGAQGLMQVMPRTAAEMSISNLENPDNGIRAGIQYMNWLQQRFSHKLDMQEKMWFMLASYNAGLGHVRDAIHLAKKKNWSSDKWFDHVEKAMLLLSKRKYAKQARHGYVRGQEPVKYVREIRDRYQAYVQLTAN